MEHIKVLCNAKINLYLSVLDSRPDGFHNIETVYHSISLHDTLTLRPKTGSSTVTCDDPEVPTGPTNLALRAANLVLEQDGRGVDIAIEKNIPIGAGLGGGSADAAGVLTGINRLYDLDLTAEQLEEMAAQLGADVKFMLAGGCAIGTGKGDQLKSLPVLPALGLVLVVPPVTISTRWAYNSLKRGLTTEQGTLSMISCALEKGDVGCLYSLLRNDFESLVFDRFPFVGEIKDEMLRYGAGAALMSGSGPVVYGVFTKAGDAGPVQELFDDKGYRTIAAVFAGCGVTVPM
jgi:4-diphosphocytidyl-2-C-methyl-D-erythritol kinase